MNKNLQALIVVILCFLFHFRCQQLNKGFEIKDNNHSQILDNHYLQEYYEQSKN